MAKCGCSGTAVCTCAVVAGPGVTVSGVGSATNPYVISAEGGSTTVADGITVDLEIGGTGTQADPYIITAEVILDPDPLNLLHVGAGGLLLTCQDLVDAGCSTGGGGATPIVPGCGLSGAGIIGDPLIVAGTVAWPFSCDIAAQGGDVYCDTAAGLKVAPIVQARTFSATGGVTPPAAQNVPAAQTTIDTADVTITNPSPCYTMRGTVTIEADVEFNITTTAATRVRMFINGDGYTDFVSSGLVINGTDWQQTRVQAFSVPPGGVLNFTVPIAIQSSGGPATWDRVQWRCVAFGVASQ